MTPDATPSARPAHPTVAVIGGGQLARMMHEAASPLSITVRVLAESSTGSAALANPHYLVGLPTDPDTHMLDRLVDGADVVTFEHEHIPASLFEHLEGTLPVRPSADALRYAQDKLAMRQRLTDMGIACPRWRRITHIDDLHTCGEHLGYPFIVKTPTGGYDGHGVLVIRTADEARAAADYAHQTHGANTILGGGTSAKGAGVGIVATWLARGPLLAEEMVDFYDELSIQVARRPSGDMATWDVVRSEQDNGVCSIVTCPAPDLSAADAQHARDMARTIADSLDVTGVLAVELFRVRRVDTHGRISDELLVNELAMRPHNTGHWSIDGSTTSQFEQHLRAVLDLPLGPTTRTAPHVVMVNLLGSTLSDPTQALNTAMTWAPQAKIHLYGKQVRPGRKLGHVTVCSQDPHEARTLAYVAVSALEGYTEAQHPPTPPAPPAQRKDLS